MLTRRVFASCAICAALGPAVLSAGAQPTSAAGGIKRTITGRADAPDSNYETIQMLVDVEVGAEIALHTHPGIESTVVLSGRCELFVKDRADQTLTSGGTFLIPASVPHGARNVTEPLRLAITYVVEKGKPLASPA